MSRTKTSSEIIDSVKRRAMLPEESATFLTADFLEILNEEFQLGILPIILDKHEEYYVYTVDSAVVSGQKSYTIPHRAIGGKVRNVQLKDSNNNVYPLTRINPEEAADYVYDASAFYFKNDQVVFISQPTTNYVSFDILLRPNELVATSRGGVISAINTTTGVVTLTSIPSHFGGSLAVGTAEYYDFVSKNSPFKIMSYDISASAVNTTSKTITFSPSDLPSALSVGDYVTWAEETIVPQMPLELIPILAQKGAIYCLESLGDTEGMQNAEKKLAKMENAAGVLIDNRSEGNPKKVVNKHSFIKNRNRYSTRRS